MLHEQKQEPKTKPAESERPNARSVRPIIVRFLLTWLGFLAILGVLALLTDINWSRPYVQEALSRTLHRDVHLGRLTWSFGLDGLAIDTKKLTVFEHGQPFLKAQESEIGIAVLPLIHGNLLIRHLDFRRPEFWAIRTTAHGWNFDDLLQYGPDIRFIRWDEGKVHLIDQAAERKLITEERSQPKRASRSESEQAKLVGRARPDQPPGKSASAWKQIDMEQVKVSFVWPRKHKKTPFFLAFEVPHQNYRTGVQITGLRTGRGENWQDCKYKVDLKTESFNPEDFKPLLTALFPSPVEQAPSKHSGGPEFRGTFDGTLSADGIYSKGMQAELHTTAKTFALCVPTVGALQAPEAIADAKLEFDPHHLQWHGLSLRLADIILKSDGELIDWNTPRSAYNAKVAGTLTDLRDATKFISYERPEGTSKLQAPENWSGKAEMTVNLSGGSGRESKCEAEIKAEDILVQDLIDKLPPNAKSLSSMLSISHNAKLRGTIKYIPEKSLQIEEAQLPMAVGLVHATGNVDLKANETKLSFKGNDLALNAVQEKLNENLHGQGGRIDRLPGTIKANVAGTFDLSGDFTSTADETNSAGTIILHNAQFALSDRSLVTKAISGNLEWTNDKIIFHGVHGVIGDGTFTLDGSTPLHGKSSAIALTLEAKNTQIEQLEEIVRMLKLQLPILTEKQLYGRVKELSLKVTGDPHNPQVYLSATPEDLNYQPPGLSRPLRAKSGTIVYDRDSLTLTDVAFAVRSDKATISLIITDLSGKAQVNNIKLQSQGFDLVDVNYYLSSVLMPTPMRRSYTSFLQQYKLGSVHGRISGSGICKLNGNNVNVNGAVSLLNAGAKAGAQKFPVEHVSGTMTSNGPDLLLDGLTGTVRSSRFNLDGKIKNYQDPEASWAMQVTAGLEPRELVELLPELSDEVKSWKLQFRAASTLDLSATVNGDNKQNNLSFRLRADPSDRMSFTTPFGSLYQPSGEKLTFDGSAKVSDSGIELNNGHLSIGNSTLATSGSIKYGFFHTTPSGAAIPSAPYPALVDLRNSKIKLQLASGAPIPAYRVLSLVSPSINRKTVQGTLDGHMSLDGTILAPNPAGMLHADKLAWSQIDLHDLSGTISLDRSNSGKPQVGKLDIPSLHYHKLALGELTGDLTLDTAEDGHRSVISVNNGKSSLAGGKLSLAAAYDIVGQTLSVETDFKRVKAAVVADELWDRPGEISGLSDGHLQFDTEGSDAKSMVSNLKGTGQFTLHNGIVSRFGQLQTKLTQANLLHQGLFGFNLNNLLQSLYPVRTGQFREMSCDFLIHTGILTLRELRYDGDDMRLWGAGTANLALDTIAVDVAGKIPRVTASVLGGPVGEVSRAFTFQKVLNVVTMHQLEALPSLPVLGEIASNKPRTFRFKVIAPLDNPKTLAQSIEKSFHWLPSKPGATAHPVPGLR